MRKVKICRACPKYNATFDACQILLDRGKAGRVTYLLSHPETRCVDDPKRF